MNLSKGLNVQWFICHITETSFITKLRAVFDASSKTSSGKSLNDVLCIGITSQSSLFEIVIRFRFYSVALTGDIRQMTGARTADRNYQRILWRFSLDEPVKEFHLNMITCGQTNSAYLAIKCIMKLTGSSGFSHSIASIAWTNICWQYSCRYRWQWEL